MGLSPLWGQIGGRLKLSLRRDGMAITPEGIQDEAYLELVLGLTKAGDVARAIRIGAPPPGVTFHPWTILIERVD